MERFEELSHLQVILDQLYGLAALNEYEMLQLQSDLKSEVVKEVLDCRRS